MQITAVVSKCTKYEVVFCRNDFKICVVSITQKDFYQIWTVLSTSVVDRHRFDADSDPNVHVDADLDPDPDRQLLLLFTAKPAYDVFPFS